MKFWRRFDWKRRSEEIDEELRSHLAMEIRDRIERGEDPREAEAAARREFGNLTQIGEMTREVWVWRFLDDLAQDLRHAVRGIRKSPGFALMVIASLALGIGANTSIFSVVHSVMLRSLPVAAPEELVELLQKYPDEPRGNGYWSRPSYEYYRDHNQVFSGLVGTAIDNIARVRAQGIETEMVAEYVTANYFATLGVRPTLGRLIGEEREPVAVISWALWNSRFHLDPGVIGKQIVVADAPLVIVGVASRSYTGPRANAQTELWLPVKADPLLCLLARLKPGVSLAQARSEMAGLFRFTIEERLSGAKPDPQARKLQIELEPARAGMTDVRDRVSKPLSVLMAIVSVVLLLACVNVAGLLVARGASRAKEMALRLGLGATRGRLVRQLLTESLLLSLFGTAGGAVVAYFGTPALLRILDGGRPHERVHLQVQPDATTFLFMAGIAVLAGIMFGLAPALNAFRSAPVEVLRQAGRASETRLQRLFGKGLASAQVALSVLLIGAGWIFIGHLAQLKSADLGFRRDHLLLVTLDPSRSGYRGERLSNAYRELLDRIGNIPGVRLATLSAPTPLHGAGASGLGSVEGFEEPAGNRRWISISYVAPRYFETLATPILAGREFTFQDDANPRVAIINETIAKHYFAGRNPLGQRITMERVTGSREPATYEIVGVAGDANYREIREAERRLIYLPAFRGGGVVAGAFVIRTEVKPESIRKDVERIVHDTVPTIPVRTVTTLSDQIDSTIVPQRLMAALSGFFALIGALLAAIGIYGLLAYTVTRRTNEIGVRMALGATSGRMLRMVLMEAWAIVAAGLVAGIPIAIWGRSVAAALIPDLTVNIGAMLACVAVAITVVAMLAAYAPARRAAQVDPMESLRCE